MTPNYSIKTNLTEEEFVRFNRFILLNNKKLATTLVVCWLLFLAVAVGQIVTGTNLPLGIGLLAGILVSVWILTFGSDNRAKKYYRQYVVKEGTEQTILFFDDHYEQSTANANANIAYKQLTAIHFNKTNIYLMRSPNIGAVRPLAACPDGLSELLQDIKKQYNL